MIMPKPGDRIIIDNTFQTVNKVVMMFDKLCVMYEQPTTNNFATFTHYIDIQCLHLHSSGEFWFKEPLTDKF